MLARAFKSAALPALLLCLSVPALAQVGSLSGKVTGEDGQGLRDAVIKIDRMDVKGSYQVKTKKKGQWFHAGLPIGRYTVALEVDGKVVDRISGVRVSLGDGDPINFDMAEIKNRQAAAQSSGASGPSKEVLASMSSEERKQYEEALKKRQQQLSKNKELNEAFNGGMTALRAKDYATAVASLGKAAEIDPEQDVVWANLADAQGNLATTKAGPARDEMIQASILSYRKALELQPTSAPYQNNLGLALVKAGQMDEGKAALAKAAEMDPTNGGKYYFNLGAVMINSGNTEAAIDAFKKATEVQPDYADAYFQLGTALVGQATTQDDGSVVPVAGTIEAFQKYIELSPSGPYAASAQAMIQGLTGSVETKYENPDKKKKKKKS